MKKVAYIAGLAGMAPAITGFIVPGPANAATTNAGTQARTVSTHHVTAESAGAAYSCYGPAGKAGRYCYTSIYNRPDGTRFYYPDGSYSIISNHAELRVSCYYSGDTGFPTDKYWDHVTSVSFSPRIGHVADKWVNFGGDFPFATAPTANGPGPALPHCG
jgi:hypothetical protein